MALSSEDRESIGNLVKVSVLEAMALHIDQYHRNGHNLAKWAGAVGSVVAILAAILGGLIWLIKHA